MIKQWGEWLNAKQFHAGIVAFICMMTSLIYLPGTFLASVIIAFTTLRSGFRFGLSVLAWVAIPAIALGLRGDLSAFAMSLLHCLIIFALALMLRHTHNWNNVLLIMTVVFVAFIGLAHLLVPEVSLVWNKILSQFMQNWIAEGQTEPSYWPEAVSIFSKVGTGVVAFVLMSSMLLELMIARFLQSITYNPGAFKSEILKIKINRWGSLVLPVFLIVIMVSGNTVFTDMLPAIVFSFMVAGLVVVHAIASIKPQIGFMVPVAYVATFIFIYLICLWALAGFLDAWIQFSSRVKAFELLKKGDK